LFARCFLPLSYSHLNLIFPIFNAWQRNQVL
jgi:hypothetical protein